MITINGIEIKPIQGYTGTDTIADDLETMTIQYDSESIDGFAPFDIAHINIPGLVKDMIVADCSATTVQRVPPVKYRHVLLLIECTKYLEKIATPAMAFTNKNDSLLAQIGKLFTKTEPRTDNSPRFHLSLALQNFLLGVKGEDFYFNQPNNLRNALDEMLSIKGIRCKIKTLVNYDSIVIDFIDQNAIKNRVETIKAVSRTKENNIEYLAGNLEAFPENALSSNRKTVWHPSPSGWDTVRTTEAILSTANARLIFKFEVEQILKFYIKCVVRSELDSIVRVAIEELDISDYIFEKERWDLLDEGSDYGDEAQIGPKTKKNTLYYTRGETSMEPAASYKCMLFFTTDILRQLIGNYMNNHKEDYAVNGSVPLKITVNEIATPYSDVLFRLEYVPYINAHAKLGKYDITNPALSKTSMYDNQSEKTIDLTRFGANLYGKINRTGNKEMTIDDALDLESHTFSELLQPGDLLYNEYIVVSRTYSIFDHSIKVQYKLSKDYNNISERISINRERRLYNIPLESLKRDILIKDYIIASTTAKVVNKPSLLNNQGLSAFLNSLTATENLPITCFVTTMGLYGPFEMATCVFPMANTLNFKTRFYDNYSAGFSIQGQNAQIIGGKKVVHNRYVDDQGECVSMTLRLSANANYPVTGNTETDFANQVIAAKTLPITNLDYYAGRIYSNDAIYFIKKDAYESLELSYVLEGRPSITDVNKIVFGFPFFTKNNLVGFVSKTLHVYASNTEYSPFENYKVKGDLCSATFQIEDNCVQLYGDLSMIVTRKAWALGDEEGNLYIACNCPTVNRIYFYSNSDLL